jgi:hypothetical protein
MKIKTLYNRGKKYWTTNMFAHKNGVPCSVDVGESFCLLGAIERFYDYHDQSVIMTEIYSYIKDKYQCGSIAGFNDNSSFTKVRKLVRDLDI